MDRYTKLSEYLKKCKNDSELSSLFEKMHISLKYVHDNDYRVVDFNIDSISVDENGFALYEVVPKNSYEDVKSDITKLCFLQIGLYADCLELLDYNYLKNNFDLFATMIPVDVIPYYKGVITASASVYLSEFFEVKRMGELNKLSEELNLDSPIIKNDKNNAILEKIYKFNSLNRRANINIVFYPIIFIMTAMLMAFMMILYINN